MEAVIAQIKSLPSNTVRWLLIAACALIVWGGAYFLGRFEGIEARQSQSELLDARLTQVVESQQKTLDRLERLVDARLSPAWPAPFSSPLPASPTAPSTGMSP